MEGATNLTPPSQALLELGFSIIPLAVQVSWAPLPHSTPPCRHCPPGSSQFTPPPSLVRAPRLSLQGSPGFLSALPASAPIKDQKQPPTSRPQIPSLSSCKEQSQLLRSSRPSAQAAGALPPHSGLCLSLPLFFAVSASLSLTRHLCSSKPLPCAQVFPLPVKRGPLLPQAFCPLLFGKLCFLPPTPPRTLL